MQVNYEGDNNLKEEIKEQKITCRYLRGGANLFYLSPSFKQITIPFFMIIEC
jgi:hypothetical protein